jgi:hypothetical protein
MSRAGAFLVFAIAAIASILHTWYRWRGKEIGDRNEMAWLYEVVDEHERGVRDNSRLIEKALPSIEREHKTTPELAALLQRARRAVGSPIEQH